MPRPARVPLAQWTDRRHRLGYEGETIAMDFLVARGWTVEAHRFRIGRQELDLVARRGRTVAFVEVKTRRAGGGSDGFGPGREAVGWRKRQAIARVAEAWRLRHGREGDRYRFDVVEVVLSPGTALPIVTRITDAWRLVV